MTAAPERPISIGLDSILEQRFKHLVQTVYPSIAERISIDLGTNVREHEDRARAWYSYRHLDLDRDHEMIWAFDNSGVVQFITEASGRIGTGPAAFWSLVDLFINIAAFLQLAHEIWMILGYYGTGRFSINLQVPGLVALATDTNYAPLFYNVNFGFPKQVGGKLDGIYYEVFNGNADASLQYDMRTSQRVESVVVLGNQVLRDLRFGVELATLRDSVRVLLNPRRTS